MAEDQSTKPMSFALEAMKGLKRLFSGVTSTRRKAAHLEQGEWGEAMAGKMLAAKGYRILGRRVRIGRRDEIDLVARDGEVLVFVEVKTRGREAFGRPIAAVDRKKRHSLSRAAVRYLQKVGSPRVHFRFDVVEVLGDEASGNPEIRHVENAFTLDKCYSPAC